MILVKKKVEILEKRLKDINPDSSIHKLKIKLKRSNIEKTFSDYEYILDCSDNFKTRFLINEFCYKMKKILVTASLQNFDLQAAILKSWEGTNPCYECFFPSNKKYFNLFIWQIPTRHNKKKCLRLELFADFTILILMKNNFSHSYLTTTE